MSWFDYQSVFTPTGPELKDLDERIFQIKSLSTPELIKAYKDYEAYLNKLRKNEPRKKRGEKSEYRSWVKLSQDYNDILNEIAKELQTREDFDGRIIE